MIRYVKKVADEKGIVVINYLADNMIHEVKVLQKFSRGHLYIINNDGYFLYSGDKFEDFAFLFDGYEDNFYEQYKVEKGAFDKSGSIQTKEGLFNYSQIKLSDDVNTHYWIVSFVAKKSYFGKNTSISNGRIIEVVLRKYSLILVLIIVVSVGISIAKKNKNVREGIVKRTLEFTAQVKWEANDSNFLLALVRFLSKECSVRYVFIDEIDIENSKTAKTVAMYANGKVMPNMEYELMYTPCHNVYDKSLCTYADNIQNLFPKDKLLIDMEAKSYSGIPLFASNGNPIGLIAVVDDKKMTDTKNIEMILQLVAIRAAHELEKLKLDKQVEALLMFNQSIIDSTEEGIVVYDKALNFLEWNSAIAEISETNRSEVIGKNILEVFPELKLNGIYENLIRVIEEDKIYQTEYEYINPSHKKYWFRDCNKPLRNHEGKIIGVIKTITDITTYKENEANLIDMRKKAEASNLAKSRFLANMSHEIRTPLNGILGMIDLSMMTESDIERNEYLTMSKTSAINLSLILNDILELSRIEENKIVLNKEMINVKSISQLVTTDYMHLLAKKNLEFVIDVPDDLPEYILVDPIRLKQVFTILIGNALKFTSKGVITHSIKCLDKQEKEIRLRFSFIDTGIGISESKINEIYERFSQGDSSSTKEYGGVGLGLTIVKSIVKLMGGELICQSKLGVGTEFYFDLRLDYSD
jgi:PAS domain S-box-containing protein